MSIEKNILSNKVVPEDLSTLFNTLWSSIAIDKETNERELIDLMNNIGNHQRYPEHFSQVVTALRKYVTFQQLRKEQELDTKAIVNHIKCTNTSNPSQISLFAINAKTSLRPHHGAGIVNKNKLISVDYDYRAKRLCRRKVFLEGEKEPFFYEY